MRGRTVIFNPATPESVKRRQFLIDSLQRSGIEWTEEIGENKIVFTYEGQAKRSARRPAAHKLVPPRPLTLEKCLKERFGCEPDEIEYWDEMIRLAAERENMTVAIIAIRDGWKAEKTTETWAPIISAHLAVNRGNSYWAITHIPTGLAAGTAQTLKGAIVKAREVAHWPEWAILRNESDLTPEFRQKATHAFRRAA